MCVVVEGFAKDFMAKQQSFFKTPRRDSKLWWIQKHQVYGGSLKYRKFQRPFDRNKLVHVVLKAHDWAAFHQRGLGVENRIRDIARFCHVKIQDLAVNKDHIHILISTSKRKFFLNFLRQVSAGVGHFLKQFLGALQIKKAGSLWLERPFTRLVSWGKRVVVAVKNYIHRNRQEVLGFVPYKSRNHPLGLFLEKWVGQFSTA